MKTSVKIYDRITRRPTFVGITFKGKSQTIPGQAVTPQQLMRWRASGTKAPDHVYMDYDIHHFKTMDKMEQIEYLRELGNTYKVNEETARAKIETIKAEQAKVAKQEYERKLKEEAIKEHTKANKENT